MIVIKLQKVEVNESQLRTYQKQFENQNIFICPNLLCPEIESLVKKKLLITPFIKREDKKKDGKVFSQEYVIPNDSALVRVLHFYLNQKDVIEIVKEISGISTINSFQGRVYKFEADTYSFDNWHDDMSSGRLLGMSLNLSEETYKGGVFRIRNTITSEVYAEVKHDTWGSSHFFRIKDGLQHMVEKVEGEFPRIAFAGWFMEEPFFNP